MPEWNGPERRQQPHDYADMRQMIREEFSHLAEEHAAIREKQQEIERKIAQWEAGACLFRWFVIATAATLTAAAGVLDWMKEHLK